MFVQRAEDDGNGAALFIDHLAERFGYIVQPGLVFEVHGRTLLENPIDDLGVVPGRTDGIFLSRTFRQRIALVPDEHADAAPLVGLLDMADLGVVDSGHVQAVNGRMRSDDILDIGAVLVALPADTVRRVVVVAEHDAVQSDTPQIGVERFGFGGSHRDRPSSNCLFGGFEAFPFAGSVSGRTEQEAKPQQQKSFHKQVVLLMVVSEQPLCEIVELEAPNCHSCPPRGHRGTRTAHRRCSSSPYRGGRHDADLFVPQAIHSRASSRLIRSGSSITPGI